MTTTIITKTTPISKPDFEQPSPATNLPMDQYFEIFQHFSILEFGSLSQTCHQLRERFQDPSRLNQLLRFYFPHFQIANPPQNSSDALKEQFCLNSNLTKGVYASHTPSGHDYSMPLLASDKERLFSGSKDQTIKILDKNTNLCIATLPGHDYTIHCLKLDGKRLFSSSQEGTIKVWDLDTNTCTASLSANHPGFVALTSHEQRLFSCTLFEDEIQVWDLNTNTCEATLTEPSDSLFSNIESDGKYLFSSSLDKTIKVWDLSTLSCIATLSGHNGAIKCLKSDGQHLYSGSTDGTIKIWDLSTLSCIATLSGHDATITCLEFDEQRLFSGSEDSTIKVWDLNTNSCSATLTFNDPISHIKYDGQRLFLSSKDHTTTVLDFAASDEDIFKEIAGLLTSKSDEIATEAMNRFSRMPPRAKNAIYGELEKPLDPNNVTNIGKRALAQAILNYLAKQG